MKVGGESSKSVEKGGFGLEGFGPAVCNQDGSVISYNEVDLFLKEQVERVHLGHPELTDSQVNVEEDFSIFRSLRKGSESRATEVGVKDSEIDLINRWRKTEGRHKQSMRMRDYYLDMLLIKNRMLRYSKSL